jgi:hypothetical protein
MRRREQMNRYGTRAREHWQTYRPSEYAAMPDPTGFFTRLGEQMSAQINALSLSLAGDDPGPGMETFFQKVGRLRMSRLQAEEQVMREMLPITEEDEAAQDEAADE